MYIFLELLIEYFFFSNGRLCGWEWRCGQNSCPHWGQKFKKSCRPSAPWLASPILGSRCWRMWTRRAVSRWRPLPPSLRSATRSWNHSSMFGVSIVGVMIHLIHLFGVPGRNWRGGSAPGWSFASWLGKFVVEPLSGVTNCAIGRRLRPCVWAAH